MFRQTLFAGTPRHAGSADAAPASATFDHPHSIAPVAPARFVVSDSHNDVLRLVDAARGVVQTVETARLNRPKGLCRAGELLYVCDHQAGALKVLDGASGELRPLAGQAPGHADGPLRLARFDRPAAVAASPVDGAVYVADQGNHCVRYVHGGRAGTLAGAPRPGYADATDELRAAALFNGPAALCVLRSGNLAVCDTGNDALRHVHVGARLVTTIIAGAQSPRQRMHHCVSFNFNANYDARSLDEADRYHVTCGYCAKTAGVDEAGRYFRRPTACCQLADGSLLVACAGGELWRVAAGLDDAQLLRGVVFGRITCLLPHEGAVYAVDQAYHCVYRLEYAATGPQTSAALTGRLARSVL